MELTRITVILFSQLLCTAGLLPLIDIYEQVTSQGSCDLNCTTSEQLPYVVERIQKGALTHMKDNQMFLLCTCAKYSFKQLECIRFNRTNAVWTEDYFDYRQQHNYNCYELLIEDKFSGKMNYNLQVNLYSLPHLQENWKTRVKYFPPPVSVTDFTPSSAYLWKASPLIMFSEANLELRVTFDAAPIQFSIQKYTLAVHDYRTSIVIPSTIVDVDGFGKTTIQRTFRNLCNGIYYVTVEPKAWDGDTCLCPNDDFGCGCSDVRAPHTILQVQAISVDTYIPDRICNGPVINSIRHSTEKLSNIPSVPLDYERFFPNYSNVIRQKKYTSDDATSVSRVLDNASTDKKIENPSCGESKEPNRLLVGIVIGVCLGVIAALFLVFVMKRRRQLKKHFTSLYPLIVIVASMDNENHLRLVITFGSFLSQNFKCRVMCNLQEQITDSILIKADYIIVVASEGAFHRYNASEEGKEYKLVKTKQPISDSLIPVLQLLNRNLIENKKFAQKVVKVKFPYSIDRCLQDEFDDTLKLTLMDEFEKLCCLIPAKRKEQNSDNHQINESYSNLINALQYAGEFHRKDPAWFTEKFYITRKDVSIAFEYIAPGFMDLDNGVGGNRSDAMSLLSGNTECVTVYQMDV